MRIISGSARGRKLQVPKIGTRPSSDRMREALFSSIDSHLAQSNLQWSQVSFVDLFAGSGAIGLEAKSRGAAEVVLVENDSSAHATIERNVADCGLDVRAVKADAYSWVPKTQINIVFLDPPYAHSDDEVRQFLAKISASVLLDEALLVCERDTRSPSPFGTVAPHFLAYVWERAYADSKLWYGQVESPPTS
jgi:16S rRNA (guanine966-N2)-methyltransferase